MTLNRSVLKLDVKAETERIVKHLQQTVRKGLRRYGAVVGISGGVDSSVVLALCVHAFGPEKVRAVMMPEHDSDPESRRLAELLASRLSVSPVVEDISGALEGFQCYARRDEAIRRVFPEFRAEVGYKSRISLPPNLLEEGTLTVFQLTVIAPDGSEHVQALAPADLLQIVAASNFKQRARMSMLYYHAEVERFAVVGTANKDEQDQGFFVKYGDGGVDVHAIAHLYKTQVYQLAEFLDVPEEIRRRTPTTDTYSATTSQEEFFFRLPFETLDLLWYAQEHGVPLEEAAQVTGLTISQVRRVFDDIRGRTRLTQYLRMPPVPIDGEPARALHAGAE